MHLWTWNSINKIINVDENEQSSDDYLILKSIFESTDIENYPEIITIKPDITPFSNILNEIVNDERFVCYYDGVSNTVKFCFKNEQDLIRFKLKYL